MEKKLNHFVLLATNLNLLYRFGKLGTCFLWNLDILGDFFHGKPQQHKYRFNPCVSHQSLMEFRPIGVIYLISLNICLDYY
jgi:hypothetical protein